MNSRNKGEIMIFMLVSSHQNLHISGTLAGTFSQKIFIFESRKESQFLFRLDDLILPENSTQRLIRSYMTLVVEDEEAWPRIHHG